MPIAFCSNTALQIIRAMRTGHIPMADLAERATLSSPHPQVGRRWTRRRVEGELPEGVRAHLTSRTLDVAVTRKAERLKARDVRSVVFGQPSTAGAFIPLGNGRLASSPELLFLEMRRELEIPGLALLGMELCGNYSLQPEWSRRDAACLIPSVCTSDTLRQLAWSASGLPQLARSQRAVSLVRDGCWSPMEPLFVLFAEMGLDELGYEVGRVLVNARVRPDDSLAGLMSRRERVPDIVVAGTGVGINYDGSGHFDIDRLVRTSLVAGENPGSKASWDALDRARRELRAKYADDRRRERDLWVSGMTVFTATSADLYEEGALDLLMGQVIEAIRRTTGRDMSRQQEALRDGELAKRRQALLSSLLP